MELDLTRFGFKCYDGENAHLLAKDSWIRPDEEDEDMVEIIKIMPNHIHAYRMLDPDEEMDSGYHTRLIDAI